MIEARIKISKAMLMTAWHFRFKVHLSGYKAEIDTEHLEIFTMLEVGCCVGIALTGGGFILKEHSGGDPALDIGVHILDLTLWFMGNPEPVAVTA